MDVSENSGFSSQIIHFNWVFPYKPSILGAHPYFWKQPYDVLLQNCWEFSEKKISTLSHNNLPTHKESRWRILWWWRMWGGLRPPKSINRIKNFHYFHIVRKGHKPNNKLVGGLTHFLEFSPRTLGKMNPVWRIFFKGVETTNQASFFLLQWVFWSMRNVQTPYFLTCFFFLFLFLEWNHQLLGTF